MAESNNRIERLHGTEKELVKVTRAFDTDGGAATIAEGFWVYYNLVKPDMGIGSATPGDAAEEALPDGFWWKAILNAAITRSVTAAAESGGQGRSLD